MTFSGVHHAPAEALRAYVEACPSFERSAIVSIPNRPSGSLRSVENKAAKIADETFNTLKEVLPLQQSARIPSGQIDPKPVLFDI
jgi:hypothetical protein